MLSVFVRRLLFWYLHVVIFGSAVISLLQFYYGTALICCCVSDAVSFKKRSAGRSDYGFHFYMELSQFDYGLLSRSRKSASLPSLNSWDDYMDSTKVADLDRVSSDDFLANYEFGATLRSFKGGESRELRRQCPALIDRFVDVILAQYPISTDFLRYAYCFCPELLLEGGDEYIFGLFNGLVALLRRCKVVSDTEASSATEEFLSFVVDVRARHNSSSRSAEDIVDVVSFLLSDYAFLARKNLCRTFKLCCLVIVRPQQNFPAVDIELSNCVVPPLVVSSCIRGVQSCVLSANYKQKSFFTKHTMECVRDAIVNSHAFMSQAEFDPWERICSGGQGGFVSRYTSLFDAYVAQKTDETYCRLRVANQRGSRSQSAGHSDSTVVTCSESGESSVASANVVTHDCRGGSSGRPGKEKKYSSLASLLGRKRDAKETVSSVTKKSKKESAKSVGASWASSSKKC